MVAVNLRPATLDLTGIRAGDRNTINVALTSAGAPMDLTGYTISAQARKTPQTADPPAIAADVTVTDAPGGLFTLRWPGDAVRTALADQASWTGVWDLQLDNGTADPWTVVAGAFTADMDVTRP